MKNSLAFARQLVEEEDAQDVVEYGAYGSTRWRAVLPPQVRNKTARSRQYRWCAVPSRGGVPVARTNG